MPQRRAKVKKELTPEEKKAKMAEDREFLQKFMEAALEGDAGKVQTFVQQYSKEHNVTPFEVYRDFKDGSKRTTLHFACSSTTEKKGKDDGDDEDIVVSILKTLKPEHIESLLSIQDEDGLTPLMLACNNLHERSYDRIKYLLEIGGSKITLMKSKAGAMALHYAAGAGASKDIIKVLIENGKEALTLLSTKIGSPLHWASGVPPTKDYSETIKTLVEDHGADVNTLNGGNISPLILAAASGNDAHAKILVEFGADRGFILGGNMNIFHVSADLNLVRTLTELLKADGSDPDAMKETISKCLEMRNERGETPLDLAAIGGHKDCIKLISGMTDDNEIEAFMTKSQEEWKQKKKEEEEKRKVEEANKTDDQQIGDLTPQQAAAKILEKKSSISEESKTKGAELKAKGNQHFAKKECEEAVKFYSEAIEHNPADETYYSNRSACYMSLKKYDEALYDAIVVRTLKPEWIKGCYRVAVALLALERFEDAAVSAFEGMSMEQDNQELKSLFQKCIKKGRKEHEEKEKHNKSDDGRKKQTFFQT